MTEKRTVWVAYTNTDCTEGRGHDVPIAVCAAEATALRMAQNIERQGVVRGLAHHLRAADAALAAVEQRATAAGPWRAPTLYAAEIEAIDTLVDVHLYQVQQLSYGEFRAAYQQTVGQVRTRGGQVVMGVAGHG